MKFKITDATNFCRVFRLPQEFPKGYCFGGGHITSFLLIDWFNPFDQMEIANNGAKEYDSSDAVYIKHIEELKEFIKGKKYFNLEYTYMILTDYGDVFLVNPELQIERLQQQMDVIEKGN